MIKFLLPQLPAIWNYYTWRQWILMFYEFINYQILLNLLGKLCPVHKMITSQILAFSGPSHYYVICLKYTYPGPSQAQPDFGSQLEAFPETAPYLKEISKGLCYTAQFICVIVLITIGNYLEYWLCFFTLFLMRSLQARTLSFLLIVIVFSA